MTNHTDDVGSGMFDKIVEVKVGPESARKKFSLHEGLLRYYSAYFEAALGGQFAEATNRVIELKEEEVKTFERFVLWLYTGKYHRTPDVSDDFHAISKLWAFGDRRQIPLLANTMVDALRDEIVKTWKVPTQCLKLIYQTTPANSALRRFTVWTISNTAGANIILDSYRTDWPIDAMFDMLQAVWKLRDSGLPKVSKETLAKIDMCPFHQHNVDNCPKVQEHLVVGFVLNCQ